MVRAWNITVKTSFYRHTCAPKSDDTQGNFLSNGADKCCPGTFPLILGHRFLFENLWLAVGKFLHSSRSRSGALCLSNIGQKSCPVYHPFNSCMPSHCGSEVNSWVCQQALELTVGRTVLLSLKLNYRWQNFTRADIGELKMVILQASTSLTTTGVFLRNPDQSIPGY